MSISGIGTQKIANVLTDEKVPIPNIQKNLNRSRKTKLFGIQHSKTMNNILKNEDYIDILTQYREEKVNCRVRKQTSKDYKLKIGVMTLKIRVLYTFNWMSRSRWTNY